MSAWDRSFQGLSNRRDGRGTGDLSLDGEMSPEKGSPETWGAKLPLALPFPTETLNFSLSVGN